MDDRTADEVIITSLAEAATEQAKTIAAQADQIVSLSRQVVAMALKSSPPPAPTA